MSHFLHASTTDVFFQNFNDLQKRKKILLHFTDYGWTFGSDNVQFLPSALNECKDKILMTKLVLHVDASTKENPKREKICAFVLIDKFVLELKPQFTKECYSISNEKKPIDPPLDFDFVTFSSLMVKH